MKEVFISFAVFVFCVSLTLFSQFNSPQVVNAAESENVKKSEWFEKKTNEVLSPEFKGFKFDIVE